MKLSVSAFRGAQASAHKKLFNSNVQNYLCGPSNRTASSSTPTAIPTLQIGNDQMMVDSTDIKPGGASPSSTDNGPPQQATTDESSNTGCKEEHQHQTTNPFSFKNKKNVQDSSNISSQPSRTKSNQRWMKLRTTVQLSGAISSTIQKSKPTLKREDSFMKRFSTRQIQDNQRGTMDLTDGYWSGSDGGDMTDASRKRRQKRRRRKLNTVVNPDENFFFYWLFLLTVCVLYNLWTLIVRQSFPELQNLATSTWTFCDRFTDVVFIADIVVQFRTGYLEQGLMVYDGIKLANHYMRSKAFCLDLLALLPLDLLQYKLGVNPILRFPRFLKIYRVYDYYYMVESRTVYPNFWRVANLIHILLILAHWFGCFYYLLSEAENFRGEWVYPYRPGDYATLTRKYLGSLYWSTLTLTTIGDLPTPETNSDNKTTSRHSFPERRRYKKSRLLQFNSNFGYIFTIVSYLIGVFIFATIVGQVGNVITNRNANRLEFERLLDGAKTYMRHHKVPSGMKRRVLRWYDYSWSRGRIQGGGDINTALGLLPDKLKTELALHVNLSVLKKVTIFQECQPEFLHDLVLKMKAYIFTPGDLICRKGEVAREMFIIADGILEVISETGHVLTTMMAGDFFGEIGILNLDGLNKRTADVRSVGYSELFSLAREDVLTAMKDYPEAQEILQTLGRKRLLEARNVTKAVNEQRRLAALSATEEENRAKNKIVERIRSDVKGLRSVLRKSYRDAKAEDSVELQPLTSISGKTESMGLTTSSHKGHLYKCSAIWNDDPLEETTTTQQQYQPNERKISAGFPLLNKLKILTDKHHHQQQQQQLQHQPQYHSSPPLSSSSQQQLQPPTFTFNNEPQQQQQMEHDAAENPVVIGMGLPLLQRLKLLKQKEMAAATNETNEPQCPQNGSNKLQPSTSTTTTTTVHTQQQQHALLGHHHKNMKQVVKKEVVFADDNADDVENKNRAAAKSEEDNPDILALWLLLKKATVSQLHNLNQNFAQKTPHKYFRKKKENNGCHHAKRHSEAAAVGSSSSIQQFLRSSGNFKAEEDGGESINNNTADTSSTQQQQQLRRLSTKPSPYDTGQQQQQQDQQNQPRGKSKLTLSLSSQKPSSSSPKQPPKTYSSISDLSPEYSGLPFVKKLKILNERQKLAELEKTNSLIRSCSLNAGGSNDLVRSASSVVDDENALTRSLSEATIAEIILRSQEAAASSSAESQQQKNPRLSTSSSRSTTLMAGGGGEMINSPSSSDETSERRNLKRTLKNISKGGDGRLKDFLKTEAANRSAAAAEEQSQGEDVELTKLIKSLMTAQTIQGYLARHTTLEKSVRCYLNSLTSPPSTCSSNCTGCVNKASTGKFLYTTSDSSTAGTSSIAAESSSTIASNRQHLTDEAKIRNNGNNNGGGGSSAIRYEYQRYPAVPACESTPSHSPSRNPDLIPDVEKSSEQNVMMSSSNQRSRLPSSCASLTAADIQSRSSFKDHTLPSICCHHRCSSQQEVPLTEQAREKLIYCVQDMEIEVQKRDYVIEILRSKVEELQRHHERCFINSSYENRQYDQYSNYFTRDDSVDTVLSAPGLRRRESNFPATGTSDRFDNSTTDADYECSNNRQFLRGTNINIEIESDDEDDEYNDDISTASETDELLIQQNSDMLHPNQNWEVLMLAQELEKREHGSSASTNTTAASIPKPNRKSSCSGGGDKMPLLNVRSLEEQHYVGTVSSQRSASAGNVNANIASRRRSAVQEQSMAPSIDGGGSAQGQNMVADGSSPSSAQIQPTNTTVTTTTSSSSSSSVTSVSPDVVPSLL